MIMPLWSDVSFIRHALVIFLRFLNDLCAECWLKDNSELCLYPWLSFQAAIKWEWQIPDNNRAVFQHVSSDAAENVESNLGLVVTAKESIAFLIDILCAEWAEIINI